MLYTFTAAEGGSVEKVLRKNGVSRRLITKLKRSGRITSGGKEVRTVDILQKGDEVYIQYDDDDRLEAAKLDNVSIIYSDEYFVVFDKPSGMPVHPSAKHRRDTLGNYFAYLYPNKTFRPINRLDRDTSGLCVVALDPLAAKNLQHCIEKTYFAAVQGKIDIGGVIDLPIARERESIIKRCVRSDGKRAVTAYEPVCRGNLCTLLKIHLETGRTHQIRVHFSHIGHPLMGDDLYGGSLDKIKRQALHCGELMLTHPKSGEKMWFTSPLPCDIQDLFK